MIGITAGKYVVAGNVLGGIELPIADFDIFDRKDDVVLIDVLPPGCLLKIFLFHLCAFSAEGC